MASVASQLIQEVTAHAQKDSLEDARDICTDGSYFPNNLRIMNLYLRTTHLHLNCLPLLRTVYQFDKVLNKSMMLQNLKSL